MNSGSTWVDASRLAARLGASQPPPSTERYRLGDGYLDVRSADSAFRDRLATLYRECLVDRELADRVPRVTCTVRGGDDAEVGLVTLEDEAPLNLADFVLQVFPDRGFREVRTDVEGWRVVSLSDDDNDSVALREDELLFRRGNSWRALAGSTAVSRLIRLQRRLLFLHAASVGLAGSGLLVVGSKGAGKTTLSLALAARGHGFLGDEIAGVRLDSHELVPLRRSLAVRTGPRAEAVTEALARTAAPTEVYPDGSERLRAQAADLFPGVGAASMPLKAVVFLKGFSSVPAADRFEPGPEHLRELTPMGATLWGMPAGRRAFDMMSMLSRTQCFRMVLGDPEDSAACVERMMEQ